MTHAFHNFLCLPFLNYFQLSQEFNENGWLWEFHMAHSEHHSWLLQWVSVVLGVVFCCPLSSGASLFHLNMEMKPALCISCSCLECSGVTRESMPYKLGSDLENVCKEIDQLLLNKQSFPGICVLTSCSPMIEVLKLPLFPHQGHAYPDLESI